jgi:NitT/TauT family transport system substrate-binding protein
MNLRRLVGAIALAAPLALAAASAPAEDQLKMAIGQINNWENQAPTLGQDAGIFKKRNLVLENVGTQGAGETMQPVISGSADLGGGVGVAGVMRAFARGAPVRILLPAFTGTGDLYWYVRADSPLKSIKDVTSSNTIAYSTSGSSSNNLVLAFIDELGVKAKPTATGGPPGTLTQVMSGQIDIGWASPPFGLDALGEGKIRIVARGNDLPAFKDQTIRLIVANAGFLERRKDVAARFVQGYRDALDWMYSDPAALEAYAEFAKTSPEHAREVRDIFYPRDHLAVDFVKGLDTAMIDGIAFRYLAQPLTAQQLDSLFAIPAPIK